MPKNVFFQNSNGLKLAGTLWESDSDALVIFAHGSGSNRFAKGLFTSIAEALTLEHYNVLSFDFSGHGESEDDVFTVAKSIDDVKAAIKFAQENGFKRIALLAHSFGVLPCLQIYSPHIQTMIFIGALTGPVPWKWENMCSEEQLEGLHKTGYITAHVNDGLRETLKVDGNLMKDIRTINQEKLLSKVTCPVLLIHGDADQQERDLLETTQKGLKYWDNQPELHILRGADHTFLDTSKNVIDLSKDWLKTHLPLP